MPDEAPGGEAPGGQAPGAGPHRSLEVYGIEVNTEMMGPCLVRSPRSLDLRERILTAD